MTPLTWVRSLLEQCFEHDPPDSDAISSALRSVASLDVLPLLVDEIRLEPKVLASACRGSYYHPTGFSKFLLIDGAGQYQLRLHFWDIPSPTSRSLELEPHDHPRDFWSFLLFGGLNVAQYAEAPEGVEHIKLRATDRGLGSEYVYEPVGRTNLTVERSYVVLKNSQRIHGAPFDVPHTVEPRPETETATLFLYGPRRQERTTVYKLPGSPHTSSATPSLTSEEYAGGTFELLAKAWSHERNAIEGG